MQRPPPLEGRPESRGENGLDEAAKCLEQLLSVLQGADGGISYAATQAQFQHFQLPGVAIHDDPATQLQQLHMDGDPAAQLQQFYTDGNMCDSQALPARKPTVVVQEQLTDRTPLPGDYVPLPDGPILSGRRARRLSSGALSVPVSAFDDCEENDEMLMSPVFARTPSSILQSPFGNMDRTTRLLALVQQREDELNQLKSERSQECSRLRTLLQKREEELAELKAQKLNETLRDASELTRQQSSSSENWAVEVERLRADVIALTAIHEQDLLKTQSLLHQCEEDLARASTKHLEEMRQVRELLNQRERELADLRAQVVMPRNRAPSIEIEKSQQSMCALQAANLHLQSEVHEKKWCLERLATDAENDRNDSVEFLKRLASSSSTGCLENYFDMSSQEFLGMGNYGYVMTCKSRKTGDNVVVKLQSERWVAVVLAEWTHGHDVGIHPHIVEHLEMVMHRDVNGAITRKLKEAFDQGILTGRRPRIFPQTYFCIAIEYMDHGSIQHLIDKGLLTVQCMAAITHQVASALAFMHKKRRTHNDIKPENILLCADPRGDCLLAKLADLGLADHSLDQKRDRALFAYTIWCAGLHRQFERCPSNDEKKTAACNEFFKATPHDKREQSLWRALNKVVEGMWLGTSLTMREVESMSVLQNLKIKLPDSKEAAADLEVCAKRDIGRRQTRDMDKWKLLRSRTCSQNEDDEDDEVEAGELGLVSLSATWPPASRGSKR